MFDHILVPLDGSALAECVLPHVFALARMYDAEVTALQVLKRPSAVDMRTPPLDPFDWEMQKAESQAYLDRIAASIKERGIHTEGVLLEGQPAECIVEFVDEEDVDLIVLSSHGNSGLSRWNVSSVMRKVVQQAHLSTMIVRAYSTREIDPLSEIRYEHLLVPLDGSQRAECALTTAETLTHFHEARLLIGHVIDRPEMPHQMSLTEEDRTLIARFVERSKEGSREYLKKLHGRLSVKFETRLRVDEDVVIALHEMVDEEKIDLVVLSAHGHSGKTRWPFGNVTTSFIEYGSTHLLMVQDLEPEEVERTRAEKASKESKGH